MRYFRRKLSLFTGLVLAASFASYKYLQLATKSPERVKSSAGIHARHRHADSPLPINLTESQRHNLFHCDRPDSPCIEFMLDAFLEQQGIAWNGTWGSENSNLPAITSLHWSSETPIETSMIDTPRKVSFIHIHKCGGSSVKAIFQAHRKQLLERRSITIDIDTYQSSFGWSSREQKLDNEQLRQQHIKSLLIDSSDTVVFTIVRDPVDRFLSAIQQVMHYHDDLRAACLFSTATATIQCVLQYMPTHPLDDVHFLPMLAHLRLLQGVRIKVFSLEHLDLLSHYFVGRSLRVRDRSNPQTATSLVLAQMSASDCSDDMLRVICDLYAVDVAMMTSMGLTTKYCSL